MEQIEQQHPTARLTTFVEPKLAELVEQLARQNERTVSAELRRALRDIYLGSRRA